MDIDNGSLPPAPPKLSNSQSYLTGASPKPPKAANGNSGPASANGISRGDQVLITKPDSTIKWWRIFGQYDGTVGEIIDTPNSQNDGYQVRVYDERLITLEPKCLRSYAPPLCEELTEIGYSSDEPKDDLDEKDDSDLEEEAGLKKGSQVRIRRQGPVLSKAPHLVGRSGVVGDITRGSTSFSTWYTVRMEDGSSYKFQKSALQLSDAPVPKKLKGEDSKDDGLDTSKSKVSFVALSSLDPETWNGRTSRIISGQHGGKMGTIVSSGNGWVQVQLLDTRTEIAKRASELLVVFNPGESVEEVKTSVNKPATKEEASIGLEGGQDLLVPPTFSRTRSGEFGKNGAATAPNKPPKLKKSSSKAANEEDRGGKDDGKTAPIAATLRQQELYREQVRRHLERRQEKIKDRPNLTYYLHQIQSASTEVIDEDEELEYRDLYTDLICVWCNTEKGPGDSSCWNVDCPVSPIFQYQTSSNGEPCLKPCNTLLNSVPPSTDKAKTKVIDGFGLQEKPLDNCFLILPAGLNDIVYYNLHAPIRLIDSKKRRRERDFGSVDPLQHRHICSESLKQPRAPPEAERVGPPPPPGPAKDMLLATRAPRGRPTKNDIYHDENPSPMPYPPPYPPIRPAAVPIMPGSYRPPPRGGPPRMTGPPPPSSLPMEGPGPYNSVYMPPYRKIAPPPLLPKGKDPRGGPDGPPPSSRNVYNLQGPPQSHPPSSPPGHYYSPHPSYPPVKPNSGLPRGVYNTAPPGRGGPPPPSSSPHSSPPKKIKTSHPSPRPELPPQMKPSPARGSKGPVYSSSPSASNPPMSRGYPPNLAPRGYPTRPLYPPPSPHETAAAETVAKLGRSGAFSQSLGSRPQDPKNQPPPPPQTKGGPAHPYNPMNQKPLAPAPYPNYSYGMGGGRGMIPSHEPPIAPSPMKPLSSSYGKVPGAPSSSSSGSNLVPITSSVMYSSNNSSQGPRNS